MVRSIFYSAYATVPLLYCTILLTGPFLRVCWGNLALVNRSCGPVWSFAHRMAEPQGWSMVRDIARHCFSFLYFRKATLQTFVVVTFNINAGASTVSCFLFISPNFCLLVTSAMLLVTSALLVVTMFVINLI